MGGCTYMISRYSLIIHGRNIKSNKIMSVVKEETVVVVCWTREVRGV
jgi:hypothetical protein